MCRREPRLNNMSVSRVIQKCATLASGPLLFFVLFLWPITDNARYTVCMMRRVTGMPCPTCGMTRSLASLAKGHLAQSLAYHPFGILVAILICAGWVYIAWFAIRDRALPRINPWILLTGLLLLAVLFVGYWIYSCIIPLLNAG